MRPGEERRDASGGADAALATAIERLRRGERVEESARVVHRRYYRPLRSYFLHKVGSPDDALDLTQETFLRVYRGIESFRGGSSFSTWIYRIASNTLAKWRDRRSRRADSTPAPAPVRAGGVDEPEAGEDDPQEHLLRRERHGLLAAAIGELPDQQRRCMILRLHQHRSYREIAVLLGISIDTVKAHLFQGRKALHQRIACALEDPPAAAQGNSGDGETT